MDDFRWYLNRLKLQKPYRDMFFKSNPQFKVILPLNNKGPNSL